MQELKLTAYTPKMAILAAKKHYCVSRDVLKMASKRGRSVEDACDDECNSAKGCSFKNRTNRLKDKGSHDWFPQVIPRSITMQS